MARTFDRVLDDSEVSKLPTSDLREYMSYLTKRTATLETQVESLQARAGSLADRKEVAPRLGKAKADDGTGSIVEIGGLSGTVQFPPLQANRGSVWLYPNHILRIVPALAATINLIEANLDDLNAVTPERNQITPELIAAARACLVDGSTASKPAASSGTARMPVRK